jgi:hypothetical protein
MNTSQERQLLALVNSINAALQGSLGVPTAGTTGELGAVIADKVTACQFSLLLERSPGPRTYEGKTQERSFSQAALFIEELALKPETAKTAKPNVTIRVLARLEGLESKDFVAIVTQTFNKEGTYLISIPFLTTEYLIQVEADQNSNATTALYILEPA